jgi:hypothetical protein
LRGLGAGKKYQVRDYENNRDYGVVIGPSVTLVAKFKGHLLLEALEAVE